MGLFNTLLSKILGRAPAKEPAETASAGPLTGIAVENRSVDISEVLDGLAAKNPEKLDWKRSLSI
jgi:hypothetical protein